MSLNFQITKEWTLFLDRDGVINERNFKGYITNKSEFKFLSGALKGIAKLSSLFGRIIVVTNQQGVGKNIMTERNLLAIHDYMLEQIRYNDGVVTSVFFATNLKGAAIDRRKPLPAMAMEAKIKYPEIDFEKSIMVGDTDSDMLFGMNLGMYTVMVNSEEKINVNADLYVDDLEELYEKLTKL